MSTDTFEVYAGSLVILVVCVLMSLACVFHAIECVNVIGECIMSGVMAVPFILATVLVSYVLIDTIISDVKQHSHRQRELERQANEKRRQLIAGIQDGSIKLDTTPYFMRQH